METLSPEETPTEAAPSPAEEQVPEALEVFPETETPLPLRSLPEEDAGRAEPPPGSSAEPEPGEDIGAYAYVGSSKSDKYHFPGCTYAASIKTENLVGWNTREEAEAAGYVPCKVCKP